MSIRGGNSNDYSLFWCKSNLIILNFLFVIYIFIYLILLHQFEPGTCFPTGLHARPAKTDQPAHPHGLIRVFAGHSVGSPGSKASSGTKRRLRSACADAQADLSLCCAQSF